MGLNRLGPIAIDPDEIAAVCEPKFLPNTERLEGSLVIVTRSGARIFVVGDEAVRLRAYVASLPVWPAPDSGTSPPAGG